MLLLIVFSCAKKDVEKQENTFPWESIEISTQKQKVTIYSDSDTASYQNAIYKRISKKAFMGTYKLEKIEKTNFKINNNERDSIYSFVLKTITKHHSPNIKCTDYVGNVSLKLMTSTTSLSCNYYSVCDWSKVSPETKKIYDLLKTKVKISSN
jgi:hypothetical protein